MSAASMFKSLEHYFEITSLDSSRCASLDGLSSWEDFSPSFCDLSSRDGSGSFDCGPGLDDGSSCSTNGSSPLPYPIRCTAKHPQNHLGYQLSGAGVPFIGGKNIAFVKSNGAVSETVAWENKRAEGLSEIDMMKEKYAKLLLGEDMSGGGKGVCSALAISNAITNLSATVFGELWRLEPLSVERKTMWQREMGWLLVVADHIVELVPSTQTFPDGNSIEVMVSQPRSDLQANLPALRKLDAMLLASLDSFGNAEFWYVDHGNDIADKNAQNMAALERQAEKWWLPSPKVPVNGLREEARKQLEHQRGCVSQILKAAVAINTQVLSEMDTPDAYWDALPKSGRASLGDSLYRHVTSECFSAEAVLSSLDLKSELKAVDVANRLEACIHVWRGQRPSRNVPALTKSHRQGSKSSWNKMKDLVSDMERKEFLAGRAESLLLCLKQKVPSLRQTVLDMTKIQCNKDVGQSILESYSRVLESLAFNIIARIDDILCVNDTLRPTDPAHPPTVKARSLLPQGWGFSRDLYAHMPFGTLYGNGSPAASPSPKRTLNSPYHQKRRSQMLSSNTNGS